MPDTPDFHMVHYSLVEVQLWAHENETKHVDRPDEAAEDPAVPRLVLVVHEGVDRVTDDQGVQHVAQVASGLLVILLGLGLGVGDPDRERARKSWHFELSSIAEHMIALPRVH